MNRTPVALLRQGRPDDLTGIREFVCGLSPRSQYLRFFAAVAPPSTGLLRALCGTAGADVLLVTDHRGAVIAHGMAADGQAGRQLESSIGLVVADAWQQQGIGTRLLRALTDRAALRGVSSLVLEVLPDNSVMRGIIGRRWPDARAQRTPDAIVYRPAIRCSGGYRPIPRVIALGHSHHGGRHAGNRSAA